MWSSEIEEIEKRKRFALQMGGKKNVAKHHARGKMTVRERIACLADENSFFERGLLSGVPVYDEKENDKLLNITPCPFVMGLVDIDGRRVAVHGDDYTVKGASVGRMYKNKSAYFAKMARSFKCPVVRLVEGAGGTIKELLDIGYTDIPNITYEAIQDQVEMMSEVPVVSVTFGAAAGLGAMYVVQSHFSIMLKGKSQVFVGGPPLVKAAFGADISKEELGGYKIHATISGVVDNVAEDENDALVQVKKFLSYLPSNVWEMPTRCASNDDPQRREELLTSIIPKNSRKTYDVRKILELVLDGNSFFEIGRYQGKSQITAVARLDGYPVGVLANDCKFNAGSFDYSVSEKFQRFIDMCDTFHLPIVNFVDQPGFSIGLKNEEHGTIRKGVRASFAIVQATIPMAVMYIRKAFGVAGAAQHPGIRFGWQYAWPSAKWGNIPSEGGVYAAHRSEIESAEDPEAYLENLYKIYRAIESPFRTAEAFRAEDIIDPKETRPILCHWVKMAYDIEKNNLGIKKRGMRC